MTENARDTPTAENPETEAPTEPVAEPTPPAENGAGEAPKAEEPAEAAPEPETASSATEDEAPLSEDPPATVADAASTVQPDTEQPAVGPKIIGMAPEPPPPPPVQRLPKQERQRPRRRRLNATQKHRNVFFARLNEFRRSSKPVDDGAEGIVEESAAEAQASDAPAMETATAEAPSEAPATETPAVEGDAAAAETPAAEGDAADAETPAAETDSSETPGDEGAGAETPAAEGDAEAAPPRQQRRSSPPPQVDRPRLIAAIDRAGGPEVVQEALQPKRDENNQPLKWATVCADACKGLKPGDPIFGAWVRLAATPVSAIKSELGLPERGGRDDRRGRGRGPRREGGDRGPRRDGGRRPREDRVSREDLEKLGTGGRVGATIRIIGSGDDEKKERERRRKEEREAKRQAERERLARLGY